MLLASLILPAACAAVLGEQKYLGCYQEPTQADHPRLFTDGYRTSPSMKVEVCIQYCASLGAEYAGLEYGDECFCSKYGPSYIYMAEESGCNKNCVGDHSQICGGSSRLSVHQLNFAGGDKYSPQQIGCYADVASDNMLPRMAQSYPGLLTPERCMGHCWRGGYLLAGMNGEECRCGDEVKEARRVSEDRCSTPCAGDSSIKCGGPGAITLYSTGIMDSWGDNRKMGCFKDSQDRMMPTPVLDLWETNSPRRCANICFFLGFKFSGVEAGQECYCSELEPHSEKVQESECQRQCPGVTTESCGGEWRLTVSATS